MMMSVSVAPTEMPIGSVPSNISSERSQSDYDPSVFSGDDTRRGSVSSYYAKPRSKDAKPRWFTHVKDWLSVSEPSAQAFKEQKRSTYKRHGIDPKDPRAAAKMHLPIEKVPAGAITSTRGPDPEKAFRKAMREKKARESISAHSNGSHSQSSSIYSAPTTRELNPITPWED